MAKAQGSTKQLLVDIPGSLAQKQRQQRQQQQHKKKKKKKFTSPAVDPPLTSEPARCLRTTTLGSDMKVFPVILDLVVAP